MPTRKGSDNRFPLLRLTHEDDTPATPPTGESHLVVGIDKVLRYIDDDGLLVELGQGTAITELDDVPDVNAPTPSNGDVLTWDSTPGEWIAAAAGAAGAPSAHGCQISRDTSDQSLGNNTFTAIQWNATDTIDTDAMHDPSSQNTRITIPSISGVTTGLWRFTTYGYTNATSPRSDVKFRKNNATDSPIVVGPSTPSGVSGFVATWLAVLSATDYIEVFIRTTSGTFSLVATDATALPHAEATFLGKVS